MRSLPDTLEFRLAAALEKVGDGVDLSLDETAHGGEPSETHSADVHTGQKLGVRNIPIPSSHFFREGGFNPPLFLRL